jgi:hypothetical protein
MIKQPNRWTRLNDLLRLDFLLGTSSGIWIAMIVIRHLEQSDPDCPFTLTTLMVSGALAWLSEVFFSQRG